MKEKRAHHQDAFLARVRDTITRHGMAAPGTPVLTAVSGGVDSMVLLHALRQLGYQVTAAHFDHQTRNGASAEDAAFVRDTCASMKVPCHEGSAPVTTEAREAGRSFEHHAREQRYAFLVDTAKRANCPAIATAHHADDQAETMLMAVLGMTSSFGLTGIAPVTERAGVRIVRPLLECSRAEIEDWAREQQIPWREDHTNRAPGCTRNRVRLDLLPKLESYNPQVRDALTRLADMLRVDAADLDARAQETLQACSEKTADGALLVDRQSFVAASEALQRRMVRQAVAWFSATTTHERIVSAPAFICNAPSGRQFELGNDIVIKIAAKHAVFRRVAHRAPAPPLPHTDIRDTCTPHRQYFDADKIQGDLYVRSRRPGDRMTPLGMQHSRKMQDIMVDRRVPAHTRDTVPLLMADDVVLWVAGHLRSAHAPVDDDTTTLLEVEIRHAPQ